jgi:hypothetical protein
VSLGMTHATILCSKRTKKRVDIVLITKHSLPYKLSMRH